MYLERGATLQATPQYILVGVDCAWTETLELGSFAKMNMDSWCTGRALGKNNTTFSKGPSCSCPLEVKGPLGATLDMKNDNATRYIGGPNRGLL